MSRADELIKNDRIVFSPKLGTFTTKGTDDQPRVVTLFPEKCSCSIKSCYHILAVKKSLGVEVNEKTTPNLSVFSAATRNQKQAENAQDQVRKPVTGDNVTEDTIGKPVTTTHDPAGLDWLQIGSIQFLKSEAATTVRSKNDVCLLHVSFQFQSKYPSKVSAMNVIDVLLFLVLIAQ